MQIRAQGPILAANAAEKRAQLLVQWRLASRDHFRNQQAGEDAVFFGDVPANGKPGALFASHRNGVLQNQVADVFESDGSLADFAAMFGGDGVEEMRSG